MFSPEIKTDFRFFLCNSANPLVTNRIFQQSRARMDRYRLHRQFYSSDSGFKNVAAHLKENEETLKWGRELEALNEGIPLKM